MNYIKQNHLSLLIIAFLVLSPLFGGSKTFTGLDRTTVGNPWTFSGAVTMSSTLTNSGAVTNNGLVTTNAGELHSYALATTTKAAAETLAVTDVAGYDTILLTPNIIADETLTFFASSTATTWLPTAGDTQRTCFVNATTTPNVYYVLAGGTGVNLQVASSSISALGSVRIGPQKMGCITFVRGAATATTFDINAGLTVYQ